MIPSAQCMPVCKPCREAGACVKPKYISPSELLASRKPRNPHADGVITLPCGCPGLPWPVIHVLGSHIREISCETHGWMELKPKKHKTPAIRKNGDLPDEPLY